MLCKFTEALENYIVMCRQKWRSWNRGMLQNAYYTANYVRWAKKFAALIDFGSKELVQLVQTSSWTSKSLQNES